MPTVLFAYANPTLRHAYNQMFTSQGYIVETATDGLDCLGKLRKSIPDLLVIELELLWGGGDGVLEVVREDFNILPTQVLLTSSLRPIFEQF